MGNKSSSDERTICLFSTKEKARDHHSVLVQLLQMFGKMFNKKIPIVQVQEDAHLIEICQAITENEATFLTYNGHYCVQKENLFFFSVTNQINYSSANEILSSSPKSTYHKLLKSYLSNNTNLLYSGSTKRLQLLACLDSIHSRVKADKIFRNMIVKKLVDSDMFGNGKIAVASMTLALLDTFWDKLPSDPRESMLLICAAAITIVQMFVDQEVSVSFLYASSIKAFSMKELKSIQPVFLKLVEFHVFPVIPALICKEILSLYGRKISLEVFALSFIMQYNYQLYLSYSVLDMGVWLANAIINKISHPVLEQLLKPPSDMPRYQLFSRLSTECLRECKKGDLSKGLIRDISSTCHEARRFVKFVDESKFPLKVGFGQYGVVTTNERKTEYLKTSKVRNIPGETRENFINFLLKSEFMSRGKEIEIGEEKIKMVMPSMGTQEFGEIMVNHSRSSLQEKKKIIKNLLIAMKEVQDRMIIHADLKPENLLSNGKEIVVIDFGIAIFDVLPLPKTDFHVQTISYRAPEIFAKVNYDEKIDNWSLGIMINEFLLRMFPHSSFEGDYEDENVHQKFFYLMGSPPDDSILWKSPVMRSVRRGMKRRYRIFEEDKYAREMVEGLLELDPSKRWSLSRCLVSPFFY